MNCKNNSDEMGVLEEYLDALKSSSSLKFSLNYIVYKFLLGNIPTAFH